MSAASTHPSLDDACSTYWLGETDAADDEATDRAPARLRRTAARGSMSLSRWRDGVRAAFEGRAAACLRRAAFVERLRAQRPARARVPGAAQRQRELHASRPDDDLVVGRLRFPAAGYDRIDVIVRSSLMAGERRIEDVPFDAARGELLSLPRLDRLREAPAHREELELRAVEADGERPLGRYVFNHRPWAGAADGGDGAP